VVRVNAASALDIMGEENPGQFIDVFVDTLYLKLYLSFFFFSF
jgi:hypothetical protein